MHRLMMCVAAICVMWVCRFASAQDRGFASAIEWSPDGETIAIASSTGLWFFDAVFNELGYVQVKQGRWDYSPRSLDWNAGGDLVAIAYPWISDSELPVRIIDVTRFEVITEIEVPGLLTQVEWHPTDNLLAAGTWSGEAFVLDALTGEALFRFQENVEKPHIYSNPTTAVCWFSGSVITIITHWETYVVDVELNDTLLSFDIRNDLHQPECHGERKIISTQNGMFHVEIGAFAETYKPWRDENDFSLIGTLFPTSSDWAPFAQDQKFSPDGSKLLYNLEGCRIRVFDTHNGRLLAAIRGGIYFIQGTFDRPYQDSLAWHPDGSKFAAVGQFGGIRIWDAMSYDLLQRFDGFQTGYGEASAYITYLKTKKYSDDTASEIRAFENRCIEELNSEIPKMQIDHSGR